MSKCILAAGIVRDLIFDSMDRVEVYLYQLQHKCIDFNILDHFTRSDGCVVIRLLTPYKNCDLIELYTEVDS